MDATEETIQYAVAEYAAQRKNRALYDAANKICVDFIEATVGKVWFKELNSPETFYTKETAEAFLTHLRENCGSFHKFYAVTILDEMMVFTKNSKASLPTYSWWRNPRPRHTGPTPP